MSLRATVEKLKKVDFPQMEIAVKESPCSLNELLQEIADVQCTAEEFEQKAKQLSLEEARTLLTATLHRSMAYSNELMPIEEARALASELVENVGKNASYYSNCEALDEFNGVGGWLFMVTNYTFESVLYCVGENEAALLVAIDED
jgi:hypothetical protein